MSTGDLRGTSRAALARLRDRLEELVRAGGDISGLGAELFAVVGLLDGEHGLRRALTDPGRDGDERAVLVDQLFRARLGAAAFDLVSAAVRQQWTRLGDLSDGLARIGVLAEIRTAEQAGTLDELEDELFRFGRLVRGTGALRAALTDRAASADRRRALVEDLLAGRATPQTVRLATQAVVAPRGLSLVDALEDHVRAVAAWRQRLLAVVHSAVPLTDAERDRLSAALARQYGSQVHLGVVVDPSVIGGLRVEIGDEVIDGTVAGRLDRARRLLQS